MKPTLALDTKTRKLINTLKAAQEGKEIAQRWREQLVELRAVSGGAGRSRTDYLGVRSASLYPCELQPRDPILHEKNAD